MRSELPKPLHRVCGRSMLGWVIGAVDAASPDHIAIVVGHGADEVRADVARMWPARDFGWATQHAQRGTGDAAQVGLSELEARIDQASDEFDDNGHVLIVPGDTPLLTGSLIDALVASHIESDVAATLVTARLENPTGYGRVVRDRQGRVEAIVEERDASDEIRALNEVNAGIYCVRLSLLGPALRLVSSDNVQGEIYLTDIIAILAGAGHAIVPFEADSVEISGVNDRAQLASAAAARQHDIVQRHLRDGVGIEQPSSTVIEADVSIEPDATILAGSVLRGATRVAARACIGPNTALVDAEIGDGATVIASTVHGASVEPNATVGPYAYVTA